MAYPLNENYFSQWSYNMAYTFGLWCADGYISDKKYSFTITLKESDTYLLTLIRKDMQSERPLVMTTAKSPNSENWNTASNLKVESKKLVSDIKELGGKTRKSLDLRMPEVPKEFLPDFVRGVFDGDGTISQDKNGKWHTGIYSASLLFLKDLRGYLISSIPDLRCSIRKSRKIFLLSFSVNNAKRLGVFMYSTPSLLFLHRKYEKFLKMGKDLNLSIADKCKDPAHSTKMKKDIEKQLLQGHSIKRIANELGIRRQSLGKYMKILGINWKEFKDKRSPHVPKYSWSKVDNKLKSLTPELLISKLSDGESLIYIGETYGVSREAIKGRCKKWGINYSELGKDKKEAFRRSRFAPR